MQNIYGRVYVTVGMDENGKDINSLLGYIEYDTTFKCAYPIIRQTIKELEQNAGKKNREYPKGSRKAIKRSQKQKVYINIETGWTTDSKTPPVNWESEICLETLTITGNRMPYNPRAVKSNRKDKEGKDDREGQYTDNLKSMYTLPSH